MPNHPLLTEWQDRLAKLRSQHQCASNWYIELRIKILRFLISRYGLQPPSTLIKRETLPTTTFDPHPHSTSGYGLRNRDDFREHLIRIHEQAKQRDERVYPSD